MTIETLLAEQLTTWAEDQNLVDAINWFYNQTGNVAVFWRKGRKIMVTVAWTYTFSNAMNNDCPGSKIGDIIQEPIGRVDKTKTEFAKYILGFED